MAAETARAAGIEVDVYEAMGSCGRKFLLAGKGGLNLTHGEDKPAFVSRYRERAAEVGDWLQDFDADALRDWARGLGVETFVGTSGRVFPRDLKAAPLLRGWLRRLRASGVRFHVQHRCVGWDGANTLRFAAPDGERSVTADAIVFALGGASWPELGSDGAWVPWLQAAGIDVAPLVPANCGFDCGWSAHLAQRHAGAPIKPVVARCTDVEGRTHERQGELQLTATGVEGGLIYALSAPLREAIARDGHAVLHVDLTPERSLDMLAAALAKPRGGRSLSEQLRRAAGLQGARAALLYECAPQIRQADAATIAACIKSLPLLLRATRPIAEAISSAGGVRFGGLDAGLMARAHAGVWFAGEMLDWEAPTGGYLLTACYASGHRAGRAAARWLAAG